MSVKPTIAGDVATVAFTVKEGLVFKIGKLRLAGESLGVEKEVLASLETKPKAVFSRSIIMKDIEALRARAKAHGLGDVDVTPETDVDPKALTIDLKFDVTRSQR